MKVTVTEKCSDKLYRKIYKKGWSRATRDGIEQVTQTRDAWNVLCDVLLAEIDGLEAAYRRLMIWFVPTLATATILAFLLGKHGR